MPGKKKILRKLEGTVISTKMAKTAVVKVDRYLQSRKYQKRFIRSRKYKCHDPKSLCQVGDKVLFVACRPLSKEKRWSIVKKIN